MSDGMSDANALGGIGKELEEAAYMLRDAIQRAQHGHRGLTINVVQTVNPILAEVGYRLTRDP